MNVLISSLLQNPLWNSCGACNLVPKFIRLFIYVVGCSLAVPRLCCCVWAFSGCGKQGLLSRGSAQVSHRGAFSGGGTRVLEPVDCNSCGAELLFLLGSVGLSPRLLTMGPTAVVPWLSCSEARGMEPTFPASAGKFFTTHPPGNPPKIFLQCLHP